MCPTFQPSSDGVRSLKMVNAIMENDKMSHSLRRIQLIRAAYMSLLPPYALELEAETVIVEPTRREKLETLSNEFKQLRAQQGYYSGGIWDRDIDAWNGRKHAVMNELAGHILESECSFQHILALMAEPDDLIQYDDPRVADFTRAEGFTDPGFFVIYFWRQNHDYLAFTVQADRTVYADWVYAEYEQQVV